MNGARRIIAWAMEECGNDAKIAAAFPALSGYLTVCSKAASVIKPIVYIGRNGYEKAVGLVRSEWEINRAVEQYSDMIRRICFCHLKNAADIEDVFQTVFLKYLLYEGAFESGEHEKAWFVRVAVNACKDHMRSLFRHRTLCLEELAEEAASITPEQHDVLDAVLALPMKYRDAIYLHYYEGYSAAEIGKLLHKKEGTVYSLLSRGRVLLKETLGGDL